MLLVFIVLFLTSASNADYNVKCTNSSSVSTTFTPSIDGIIGRYIVEYCRVLDPNALSYWELRLEYMNNSANRSEETCKVYKYTDKVTLYSRFSESLDNLKVNCTNLCFSKILDMVDNGCYVIKSWLRGRHNVQASETVHYIRSQLNNVTNKVNAYIRQKSYGDVAFVVWHLGYVPATEYVVTLSMINHSISSEHERYLHEEWEEVTQNCSSVQWNEVQCPLTLPFGCYNIIFTHTAPWTLGSFFLQKRSNRFSFCHERSSPPLVESGISSVVWWSCGAVLLLSAAALAASLAWRSRVAAAWHKRVLRDWQRPRYEAAHETPVKSPPGGILLLYARDCDPFMSAMSLLRDLLREVTRAEVYDIFSPDTFSLSASAPNEWIRNMLRRDDVRVVLVQTPAAACLYDAEPAGPDHNYIARAPLLHRRVVYRAPHHSDGLLQYALRLVKETAHHQLAYKKYYVATLSDLPADYVENVASFRRYELPAATELLLQHLSPEKPAIPTAPSAFPSETQRLIDEFSQALTEMTEHARVNQNYLQDLLMFL